MRRPALLLLFAAWLCSAQGWAQPASGAVALIDTRQECAAFGGAWVASNAWQSSCQPPWGRAECLRLGGSWLPVVGAPLNGICVAQVSETATARQCTQAGGTWGPAGSPMPFCRQAVARRAVTTASDAEKVCDSQNDCTYGCIYRGPPVADGTNVLGRCRPTNAPQGCYSMVEKGRLAGSICVKR